MSSPVLVTIVLNWNKADLSISCAESVLQAYRHVDGGVGGMELLLVDNGSDSRDFRRLEQWCLVDHGYRVRLLRNTSNLGYAAGMNAGIRDILRENPAFIWLLNNDTQVAADSVSHLLEFASRNTRACIIGSTMLDPAGSRVLTAGGYRYFPWLGYSRPLGAGLAPGNRAGQVGQRLDYVDGAAMWIRSDVLQRSNGLPERHFLYFEELELNRLLLPLEELAWCPESQVIHRGGASSDEDDTGLASYYAALSAFRYTAQAYPYYLPTVMAARVLGVAVLATIRMRPAMLAGVLRALWSFVRGRAR